MFTVYRIIKPSFYQGLSRPNPFTCSVRKLNVRKIVDALDFENLFKAPTVDKLQKNVIPTGHKVVYISGHIKFLNLLHYSVFLGAGLILYNFSGYFTDPNWLEKDISGLGKINPFVGVAGSFYILSVSWVLRRNVRLMFKKDDKYKSLYYGFLGPFRKIYVDHGKHEITPPKTPTDLFYYIGKNRIILHQEFFLNQMDYWSAIGDKEME